MKPIVVGLGNLLAGDDGVAWYVLREVARAAPDRVATLWGGTDLLRHADALADRPIVVLIDAVLDGPGIGETRVWTHPWVDLDSRQSHVHHLSVVQAIELLRLTSLPLSDARFILVGVGIAAVRPGTALTPALRAQVPRIARTVLELV